MRRIFLLLTAVSVSTLMSLFPHAQSFDRPVGHASRSVAFATHGMIATSQPLAALAGLRVLQAGGNAIDAAVTAAATLAVVEPTMTGIGGDLFALVYLAGPKQLRALNASGRSPYAATRDAYAARGLRSVPVRGIEAVTVPGVVDGWAELLGNGGTYSLGHALEPAIAYAEGGYPVSEVIAGEWKQEEALLAKDPAARATFLIDGRAPRAGELFKNPRLGATLRAIAAGGRDAFYRGPIARAIVADSRGRNGFFDARDFADHHSTWGTPVSTSYHGVEVFEIGPNTQGLAALEMLNLLERDDLKALGHDSADYLHLLVEAKKIAYADRDAHITDPERTDPAAVAMMLSKEYAARRRKEIDPAHAAPSVTAGAFSERGDTIYLTVVDADRNVVSLIQSLFDYFGAGIAAGDTGIALQNRGSSFSLNPAAANRLEPHKRPFHTLIPAMVFKDGRPYLSFGVMGGDMQAQGHAQVLLNLLDFGMNVQEAGEAARVRHTAGGLLLERALLGNAALVRDLSARGHHPMAGGESFGGYQAILIDPSGVLMGGSDPRKDGLAIGW